MLSSRFSFWPHALRSRHHHHRSTIGRRLMLRPNRKNTHRRSSPLTRMDRFSLHRRRWSHLHLRPRLRRRQRWQKAIIPTESLSLESRILLKARIRLANISTWKDSLPALKSKTLTPTRFSLCRNAEVPEFPSCGGMNTGLTLRRFMRRSGRNITTFRLILWSCG